MANDFGTTKQKLVLLIVFALLFLSHWGSRAVTATTPTPTDSPLSTPTSGPVLTPTLLPTPLPTVTSTSTNYDLVGIIALVLATIGLGIEMIRWVQGRGRIDLTVVLTQTTLKKWRQYELDDVPDFNKQFVPDPSTIAGRIRTAFTVIEFSVTNLYKQPVVIQDIAIVPNEEACHGRITGGSPAIAWGPGSRCKSNNNFWIFDSATHEPVSLAASVLLRSGESVARRIEFLVHSHAPEHWQGSYFITCVSDEKVFTHAEVTVCTNRKVLTVEVPIKVVEYDSIKMVHDPQFPIRDPRSVITTWRKERPERRWTGDGFPECQQN